MNTVSNVVTIKARAAPARGLRRPARPHPRVFIVDKPKTYLLAAILGAMALLVAGALSSELLSMPRGLACEVPAAASQQSPGLQATNGDF
jgi:hypothetical protein